MHFLSVNLKFELKFGFNLRLVLEQLFKFGFKSELIMRFKLELIKTRYEIFREKF